MQVYLFQSRLHNAKGPGNYQQEFGCLSMQTNTQYLNLCWGPGQDGQILRIHVLRFPPPHPPELLPHKAGRFAVCRIQDIGLWLFELSFRQFDSNL